MSFEEIRAPDFTTAENFHPSVNTAPEALAVRMRSPAGADGNQGGDATDPGDEGEGGPGSMAELLVESAGSDVELWAATGLDGYFDGGGGGELGVDGGDGGGATALLMDGNIIAICGGGGGGGAAAAHSGGIDGSGGGGGAAGGLGGDGKDTPDGEAGEDAESAGDALWNTGGDGGDAGSTGDDGEAGAAEIDESAVLVSSLNNGSVNDHEPESDVWIYADFGPPNADAEYLGPAVGAEVTWVSHDCDEIRVYRDGSEIATVDTNATEYLDATAPTNASVDYTISAVYCGHEEVTAAMTVDTSTVEIADTAELDGDPLGGATVTAINRDEGVTEAETTTDSNGAYSLEVRPGYEYHIIGEYDDGTTMYNAASYPYLTP